ncbi:MAG: ABC transporter substrate-binding protein [Dermatophilaceae bacterium]
MRITVFRRAGVAVVVTALAIATTACGSDEDPSSAGKTEITLLTDNGKPTEKRVEAIVEAFEETNPDITVTVNVRPGGPEGNNLVKTKIATGEMEDVFWWNSGSVLRDLDPAKNLVDLTGSPAVAEVEKSFLPAVTVDDKVYGAPWDDALGGGILYNTKVYADLGLQVPKTWAEFVANNDTIKAAGIDPVLGSFKDRWTTQLFVLGDFHNVVAAEPDWADRYNANQAKYAVDPVARRGFEKTAEVAERGWLNRGAGSMTAGQAVAMLAAGKGAHFATQTSSIAELTPEQAKDIGFFGVPGDTAASAGRATLWMPGGQYIPKTSKNVEAAKKFVAFAASPEGVAASVTARPPTGPSLVTGATLPDDARPVVKEIQKYLESEDYTLALEFASPVKGPSLAQITESVMSGQTSAADAAKQYDNDVVKQAKQLGLPGW